MDYNNCNFHSFECRGKELGELLNNFKNEHSFINIIDIKFTSSVSDTGNSYCTALIIYRE